ncbi:unnamed protein product, partial [Rotaria sp. Silwood1]
MAICGSANINDRSLVSNSDSEFCIVINDLEEEDDRFNEESVLVKEKRLIGKKKQSRRKELVNDKSRTIEIHLNRHSKSNLYSSSNLDIIHQLTCRYNQIGESLRNRTGTSLSSSIGDAQAAKLIHQLNCRYNQIDDSLSNRTGASLSPSIGDAPAASPEQSYILDLIHITNAHLDNMDIIQHSSSFYCDQDNSSILSILLNNISINKQPIKSNCLDFENTEKYLEENQCDCCRQYIENEKLTINEEQDDDNILKRKSKMSIYMNKFIWSYWNKFQKSISNFVAGKYFHRIVLS